jgi:hypothetical protein
MNKLYPHNKLKKIVWSNSLPVEKKVIPLAADNKDTIPVTEESVEDPDFMRSWEFVKGEDSGK